MQTPKAKGKTAPEGKETLFSGHNGTNTMRLVTQVTEC